MTEHIDITYHPSKKTKEECFSILIPSWNNLPYLKLCIDSINKNSSFSHQIIVHINEGFDGTLEWVKSQKDICYSYSAQNIGVCYALNSMVNIARTEYILYMNDDMYVCPNWDQFLVEEIKNIGHNYFFISATAIEPRPQSRCSIAFDFGTTLNNFNEEQLLKQYDSFSMQDWQGATWPPNIVHKQLWLLVGGYSTEFSPGMYSDPDFSMKLWQAGVRHFKGVSKSRVYHFGSISVKRVKKNSGYHRFILKWGITAATFSKYYIKRGEKFNGPTVAPRNNIALSVKSIYKQIIAIFHKK